MNSFIIDDFIPLKTLRYDSEILNDEIWFNQILPYLQDNYDIDYKQSIKLLIIWKKNRCPMYNHIEWCIFVHLVLLN